MITLHRCWFPVALLLVLSGCAATLRPWDCSDSVQNPIYQENDEWVWRTTTGHETAERVGWLDEGNVYFYTSLDGEQIGQKGIQGTDEVITMTNRLVTHSEKSWDFPLQVGKAWSYMQTSYPRGGGPMIWEQHRREVVGCEFIETPAGAFRALKLLDTTPDDPLISYYSWYAPMLKHVVKREYVQGAPRPMTADEPGAELVRYTLQHPRDDR
ncbi:MAG: hypothetical protein WC713_06000 [Candidatus Methylomirabilota bacterium]